MLIEVICNGFHVFNFKQAPFIHLIRKLFFLISQKSGYDITFTPLTPNYMDYGKLFSAESCLKILVSNFLGKKMVYAV